ncbi:choice-of-anchor M domain-containing protein [Saccharothrix coeruleofusca]|uniref:Surface-anchored protein n=1 Tax=Saccharothrix coeruleofusca TaxID=33919 RepID=A0A918APK5_9PSEU|nr:choice-of-anchor M domain-containing protein [Saccharothrix coeruleofusca]MBP2337268.1 putative ABC transporter-associated repeat protein [Saccharothrix coeruleofusca]GGP66061.1 hypothetical protein GCM10010185_43310 [Saccharothrix coeruleofusca]
MTHARTGALLGVAAALLVATPTASAQPVPTTPTDEPTADVVLDAEGGGLSLDAPSASVEVPAGDDRVELDWDTAGVEPGTVFGDAVTLSASLLVPPDPAEPAAQDGPTPEEQVGLPAVLPVGATGTLEVDAPAPGEHVLRVRAQARSLDGRPLAAERDYRLVVAEVTRPETGRHPTTVEPRALPQVPAPAAAQPRPGAAAAAPPPTATGRVTLDRGHVDAVAPRLLPDGLHLQVKDGTVAGTATWREPSDVEFRVTAAARTALPAQPQLSFLGGAGKQVHLLPQTQRNDLLWTGWSTEELRPAEVSGPVTWALTAVDGPGAFGLFTTGSFGAPTVIFNSTDGLPDTHSAALGTHAHANWVFAEPGRYRLTFTVSAPRAGGGALTDTETYTFVVGDGAGTPADQRPANTGTDTDTGTGTGTGRQSGTPNRLASTGPVGIPATAGLALVLIATGAAALVLTRRRPAPEEP